MLTYSRKFVCFASFSDTCCVERWSRYPTRDLHRTVCTHLERLWVFLQQKDWIEHKIPTLNRLERLRVHLLQQISEQAHMHVQTRTRAATAAAGAAQCQ